MQQKKQIYFPSRRDPLDSYLADLTTADPLGREDEIEAARCIEEAEERLFDVVLESGVPLPELARLAHDLEQGRVEASALARRGEHASEEGQRWVRRRMTEVRRLEARRTKLEEQLRTRQVASKRKRAALRDEVEELRDARNEKIRRIGLNRDRVEKLVNRVDADLRLALGGDGQAATDAAHALARPKQTLRRVRREMDAVRRDVDRAKGRLTEANLRLVVAMAKRFRGRGVAYSDLIQEGNLGLMRAVDKFDRRVGTRFSTYAGWWIKQSMARLVVCQGRDVRVPIHMTENVRRALRAHTGLTQQLGREPTFEEIAGELAWSVQDVRAALEATPRMSYLETPLGDEEGDRRYGDLLSDDYVPPADDTVLAGQRKEQTHRVLQVLSPRERRILSLRFGFDGEETRTLQQIGDEMGLSRERIRQLEAEALDKLCKAMETLARPEDGGAAAA